MKRIYSGIEDLIEMDGDFYVPMALLGESYPGDRSSAFARCLANARRYGRTAVDKFEAAHMVGARESGAMVRVCEESVRDFGLLGTASKTGRRALATMNRCLEDVRARRGPLQNGAADVLDLAERDVLFYNQWQDAKTALTKKAEEVEQLEKALTEKAEKIAQLEKALTKKAEKIEQLEKALTEKAEEIAQKAGRLTRVEAALVNYRKILGEYNSPRTWLTSAELRKQYPDYFGHFTCDARITMHLKTFAGVEFRLAHAPDASGYSPTEFRLSTIPFGKLQKQPQLF